MTTPTHPRRRWFRPRLRSLLLLVGVMVLVSVGFYYYRSNVEADVRGHLLTRQEWPQTFVDLLQVAEQIKINVGNIRVYQMSHDEYFWTSDASPELFALMSERWSLRAVKTDHGIVRRFRDRMPTDLVPSIDPDGIAYYASSNWLEGEKGHLYCAVTDNANQVVVRY